MNDKYRELFYQAMMVIVIALVVMVKLVGDIRDLNHQKKTLQTEAAALGYAEYETNGVWKWKK